MKFSLTEIEQDALRIRPQAATDSIQVTFAGSCDPQTMPLLDRFLSDLHVEMMRLGAIRVEVDCESLYFMNSASVKCFVTWLAKVQALPRAARYRVVVRTNGHLAWQQRSFRAIARSAPDVVSLDS
jgi:hypothetical protein